MLKNKNPFIAGNWVRGESFFGRDRIIHEILDGNRDFIWVAGTRRFGKTSLLKQLEWLTSREEEGSAYVSLFWDMQGSRDLDGLGESILESIEDEEERFEAFGINTNELEMLDLFGILRQVRRKLKAGGRKLLLLCDEAEELINLEKHNPEALPKLRRILQRGADTRTVLTATKRLEQLEAQAPPDTSPFLHGFVPPIYLPPLEDEQTRRLLRLGHFDPAQLEEIMSKANNHPYLTQLIARRLYEVGHLNNVIDEIAMDDMISNFFSIDFKYLDEFEKELLLHILSNDRQTLEDLQQKFIDPGKPLMKALYELHQLGFIHQVDKGYLISNYFFRQWLTREKERLFSDSAIKRAEVEISRSAAMAGRSQLPQIGDSIGQHEILERIGSGGMGIVYKARDVQLHRTVALKLLAPELVRDDEFRDRFLVEARAASAMNHPNIATIYQIGQYNDAHYLSMEYVEGVHLKEWRRAHANDISLQLSIAIQAANALSHAHKKKVVHRDIKSDNILVNTQGEAKVMDFGLAKTIKRADSSLTKTGTTLGTLAYMSPEQASGLDLDHRTDIFSFGVVLYELFTGALPFTGDYELSVMYAILNEEPKPPRELRPELSEALQATILRAMEKDRKKRFQSMTELVNELELELENQS